MILPPLFGLMTPWATASDAPMNRPHPASPAVDLLAVDLLAVGRFGVTERFGQPAERTDPRHPEITFNRKNMWNRT